MRKLYICLGLMFGCINVNAIALNTDLLDCIADGDGFRNLCKVKSGPLYSSALTKTKSIDLSYLIDYTYTCHDSFKGGAAVARIDDGSELQPIEYFAYNGSQLKLTGYGDLFVVDDNPGTTSKSIFAPTCALKVTKVSLEFSPKQVEAFKRDICQINTYAGMKGNVAIIHSVAASGYASVMSQGTLEQKVYYLNRIKDGLSRLLWVEQDPNLQNEINAIIGNSTMDNSLEYLITHPDIIDFNIKMKELYTRLDGYFKSLDASMTNNVEQIYLPIKTTLQNAGGLAKTPELSTNLSYVYNLFSDKDISGFTPPSYCRLMTLNDMELQ